MLIVVIIALSSFGVAIQALASEARKGCVARVSVDPSYQVELLSESQVSSTEYDVQVIHDGKRVIGAKVCMAVAMEGMPGMGDSNTGREVMPGVYRVSIVFPMVGGWVGAVQVTEKGHKAIDVPLSFTVT